MVNFNVETARVKLNAIRSERVFISIRVYFFLYIYSGTLWREKNAIVYIKYLPNDNEWEGGVGEKFASIVITYKNRSVFFRQKRIIIIITINGLRPRSESFLLYNDGRITIYYLKKLYTTTVDETGKRGGGDVVFGLSILHA